jgi:hypothetical protein
MTDFKSQLDISHTIEINSNGEKCNYAVHTLSVNINMLTCIAHVWNII